MREALPLLPDGTDAMASVDAMAGEVHEVHVVPAVHLGLAGRAERAGAAVPGRAGYRFDRSQAWSSAAGQVLTQERASIPARRAWSTP